MTQTMVLVTTLVSGLLFFVVGEPYWVLGGLLVLTALTRFRSKTAALGKFLEILLVFYLIWYALESFGAVYPGSLIVILTLMVVLIFFEGPEWGQLFFLPGKTSEYIRPAFALALLFLAVFGVAIYLNADRFANPVPLRAPVDTLIIMGVGFAFYLPAMEEMMFRSFLLERAQTAASAPVAVLAQALLYGFMSYKVGVPPGALGGALGFIFGLALGGLVYKSQSLYPSMLCHFVVTLGMFFELAVIG